MEPVQFDRLTRRLAIDYSRRRAVSAILGVGALGVLGFNQADDALARRACKPACGECQWCKKGKCKKSKRGKVCKKGKCLPRAAGASCSVGSCQQGVCVAPPRPFCEVNPGHRECATTGATCYCTTDVSGAPICIALSSCRGVVNCSQCTGNGEICIGGGNRCAIPCSNPR
jgi:hypothetical protein